MGNNTKSQIVGNAPMSVRARSGLALPRVLVPDYLLAHQLNTDSRIKRKRGAMYQQACVRYDYMCYNYERCPFHLVQYDYSERPDTSYFIIARPHLHAGEQTAWEKFTTYPELSAYLRRFRGTISARELQDKAAEYVQRCLQLQDELTAQHRRQFPQYLLQHVVATDVDQILPDLGMLRSRIQYFRRQDFLLADHGAPSDSSEPSRNVGFEPLSILHHVVTSATHEQ